MFKRVDNTKTVSGNVQRVSPFEGKAVVMVQSGGTIRIFPAAMAILGLVGGSRVAIGQTSPDGVEPKTFGIAKTQHQDVEGQDNNGRKIDENGKLSSIASSALLGEGNVYEVSTTGVTEDGLSVHALTFVQTVKLPKRKNKVEVSTDAAAGTVTVTAPIADATTNVSSESDAINAGSGDVDGGQTMAAAPAPQVEEEDEY